MRPEKQFITNISNPNLRKYHKKGAFPAGFYSAFERSIFKFWKGVKSENEPSKTVLRTFSVRLY